MADEDAEYDELETELEEDETPYVQYDISVAPSDPTLELLSQQIGRGDIIIPFYQRKFVWKIEQASRLIESFLMGLPVPQVFLYVNSEDQLEVIDGQQRLKSVHYFMEGYFGDPDDKGRRQVFRLKGLSELSGYNGKTFLELSDKDRRKLRNSTLRAINIKQLRPSAANDSVFHIFERLNTGGTQLKPQEIRNAVYRGQIVDELRELNETPGWRQLLGITKPDKNQKDIELILRLFSLFDRWEEYEKPMLGWLNRIMSEERSFDSLRAKRFRKRFPEVVTLVNESIDKPFRPKRVINAAVLEGVMITLLEHPELGPDVLTDRYDELLDNDDFLATIRGATTDTLMLKDRLIAAENVLADVEE
jgi:hypothetical protein